MTKQKLFLVDEIEDGVLEWKVEEDGSVLDSGGGQTAYSFRGGTLHIWEGDHWQYGDRDEDLQMEDPRLGESFFTFSKEKAEGRLAALQAAADAVLAEKELNARRQAALKEVGLDDETVRIAQEKVLRERGLLD
ncbi:hypothetical protein HYV73_03825 [Candidatus Uhrbacteria bacterium]|nr:hypothetical protein [Candidatus Uhrbacteria bacterium]